MPSRKLSVQFVRYISQTGPALPPPFGIPHRVSFLQPPAERPRVFLAASESAGAVAIILRFYHLRAQRADQAGWAQPASTTSARAARDKERRERERQARVSSNGPSVRGTLSRGAHLIQERIRSLAISLTRRFPSRLRAQLVIDSHFRRGVDFARYTVIRQGHSIESLK